ncbi:hypothetical protein BBP00_00007841 [Phytophthora kernoviae]|uniref:START domain-containing protein n=1 Tax=Phytophthora kernoviae TaxID=325452 RepID=A0A3F2RH09_9STRA|nr:hypothetical protein BBP00_00007841 [Phytophthora kernoviae]
MVKARFTMNPFEGLELTATDTNNLLDIVNTIVDSGMQRYENFWSVEQAQVSLDKWKLIKMKENLHIFMERQQKQTGLVGSVSTQTSNFISEMPSLLCVGTTLGNLDDVMLGAINPSLEDMRLKASYVDDLSGAAVLSNIVMPTEEDPFRSVVAKWMELDVPFQSTGLVQNRDYVYVEATGIIETFDDERVGFHLLHSVNFPQAHPLPNRVRANLSTCAFFRQVRPNVVSIYVTGVMDPVGSERVSRLVVANMANTFCSTLKYAHCGQMKKLTWSLDKAYSKSKTVGTRNPERNCLCFGIVCSTCKLQKKLSFVAPDLSLVQRKVVFCAVCMHDALKTSTFEATKAQIVSASSTILDSNLSRYEDFLNVDKGRVDPEHWKLVKSRDSVKVFSEKNTGTSRSAVSLPQTSGSSSDLPSLLCVGSTVGDMEDMMFGVVNPTLEIMRIKASYVEDLSGAAVLANIVDPTLENPFNSLVVKWMEMDIPLQSMGLVKNRDYIYVEATGIVHLSSGEKVGYHILHSVNFPETHDLPGRVRANLSICGFFRQIRPNCSEIFITGLMDPGGDMIRMLMVPTMATAFLATLKYAHCGQMKKLQYMLEKRYTESKELGTPNREHICVTCSAPITNRRLGDFGKSDASCRLCFGFVCHSCKIQRKLSFVTPDLLLAQRKVTFCAVCLNEAVRAPAADAARAQIITSTGSLSKKHSYNYGSEASTISEYASSYGG